MRWLLFVMLAGAVGCGKSGPSAADEQAELAVLDRLEKELASQEAEFKKDCDAITSRGKFAAEKARAAGIPEYKLDPEHTAMKQVLEMSKSFDISVAPLKEKIDKQKKVVSDISAQRRGY